MAALVVCALLALGAVYVLAYVIGGMAILMLLACQDVLLQLYVTYRRNDEGYSKFNDFVGPIQTFHRASGVAFRLRQRPSCADRVADNVFVIGPSKGSAFLTGHLSPVDSALCVTC